MRIEVHVFVEAFAFCNHGRMEAHCVVKTGFDVASAMGGCAVKVCDFKSKWFNSAFEVWPNRGYKNSKLIFVGRFYADNGRATKHKGAYIQACARAIRWHKIYVCANGLFYCVDKLFYW